MKKFLSLLLLLSLLAPGRIPAVVDLSPARHDYFPTDGKTASFAYAFRILDKSHLEVVDVDASGVETVKTVDTDYSVDGVGAPTGGNVTFFSPPAGGHRIVILRKQPIE